MRNLLLIVTVVLVILSSTARLRLPHQKLLSRRLNSLVVPDQYLVVLRDDIADVQATVDKLVELSPCSNVIFVYQITIKGFALADCSEDDLALLLNDPAVQYAVEDETIRGNSFSQDTSKYWWLDRTDEASSNTLDGTYEYTYDGTGVKIYVLDSGVRSTHVEFAPDRAVSCGFNAFEGIEPCEDNNGHGTFNSACAAGATYGIAKNANIVNVRVLRQSLGTSIARVIAGIEFVGLEKANNAAQPMVVNMSLSSSPGNWLTVCLNDLFAGRWALGCFFQQAGRADTLTLAAEKLVDMGVSVVASVANDGNPFKTPFGACFTSPAKSSKLISVGAINRGDTLAFYSQYGFCTDIFAPGTDIQSAWHLDDTSTNTAQGTSISTAFVSGAAALYLQKDPSMTPEEVKVRILEDASNGAWLGWFSPNRILSTAALLQQ